MSTWTKTYICNSEISKNTDLDCQTTKDLQGCYSDAGNLYSCGGVCNNIQSSEDEGRCKYYCPDYLENLGGCVEGVITSTAEASSTSLAQTTTTDSPPQTDTGVIVGSIVGVLLFLFVCALLCYCCRQRIQSCWLYKKIWNCIRPPTVIATPDPNPHDPNGPHGAATPLRRRDEEEDETGAAVII